METISFEGQSVDVMEVRRDGPAIWNRIHFYVITDEPIGDALGRLQAKLGYHPCGYDGPWGGMIHSEDKRYHYKWTCSAYYVEQSCD